MTCPAVVTGIRSSLGRFQESPAVSVMISQTTEYALRAVVYLATNSDRLVSRNTIAEATCVPTDYLTKVLQGLDRANIVVAQRGPGGGYQLHDSPEDISVYDVVEAISAVPRIRECPLGIKEHAKLCPLHKRLDEAAELVEKAYRATKISELIPATKSGVSCKFPKVE